MKLEGSPVEILSVVKVAIDLMLSLDEAGGRDPTNGHCSRAARNSRDLSCRSTSGLARISRSGGGPWGMRP